MVQKVLRLILSLGLVLTPAASPAQNSASKHRSAPPAAQGPIRHVIVVSVDGLMPESYVHPDAHGLKIPTLREIVRGGTYSEGARSVFPTMTYAVHTSIATGVNPRMHGIMTNYAWDPLQKNQDGWRWYAEDIRVPTLWDVARAAHLRTALLYWPATVGARADFLVPEMWRAGSLEDAKLIRALSTPGLFDAVAKRFPKLWEGLTPPEVKDAATTDIATYLIETERPHLLLMHIFEVDHWEHERGVWSAEALAAIENADVQIARVIAAAKKAGIWEHTALVVVSDHGFAPITQRVRPGVLLAEKGLVTLDEKNRITDWKAVVLTGGGQAYLYVKDPADRKTQELLLETFVPLAGKPGSGIGRVYTREEIRALGGDADAFLALEGADGFGITGGYAGDYISAATVRATHGYNPERADMQASLLVYGPRITPKKIEGARLIDVAPTIAAWLGLRLTKAEGRRLDVPLRSQARAKQAGRSP